MSIQLHEVVCVKKPQQKSNLTVGKTYMIREMYSIAFRGYCFQLRDDRGKRKYYSRQWFMDAKEYHNEKFNIKIDKLLEEKE